MLALSINQPDICQHRVYIGGSELRRMRQSSGSPILAAAVEALPEPLSLWMADDWGVDEQGVYELVFTSDLCQGTEDLQRLGTS